MSQQEQIEDIAAFNENSLQELSWAIASSRGEFSLLLAHCNSASLRQRLMQRLQEYCPVKIREIILDHSITTLYTTIQAELGNEHPQALIVSGLESVKAIDSILMSANQVREEFRKNFPFPVVLWVTDEVLQKLIRLAPDMQSWTTTVEFAIPTDDLIQYIQQTADEVFAKVLAVGAGRFLDNTALNLGIGSPRRTELELAWVELQNRGVVLHPEIEASLEFVLGRDAYSSMEQSRQHYERSLALLQQAEQQEVQGEMGEMREMREHNPPYSPLLYGRGNPAPTHSPLPKLLEQRACLLYCMGLWWRTHAVLHHIESDRALVSAKDYFQESITVFEQANREDLVANFINGLGTILQRLQQWDELEVLARRALTLHQTYPHQFRLARAYGFLAEVALAKSAWTEALEMAQQALVILNSAAAAVENAVSSDTLADLEWEQSSHRGLYLLALARAQLALGEKKEAIVTLETANEQTKQQYDPELYIQILRELRKCYLEEGEYLKAFNIKLEQRSSEQKYGFRAFIGAGRLQPKQQITNPSLALVEQQETVAQEIAATGREQDIKRLVERIGCADRKLSIIYGQSGVGKSSILQAGLIPVLKHRAIGTRDVVPVLQQVYPDWMKELGDRLKEALLEMGKFASDLTPLTPLPYEGRGESGSPPLTGEGLGERSILDRLQLNADNELLTVLIFDQFEEFFFVYKDPKQRLTFYNFLRDCLDIPHARVILSLREDYLYYLLECNDRLTSLEVINNNILDKDILYYLGNFSRRDAQALIKSFTQTTKLFLAPSLINELVEDLAGDFGEIRPIELQVVGTQLQTEKITTLEQYREHGPKEKLVGRFLEEVIKDCGAENEQIAKLVLYLLTDENNTRPLKTRADLELELEVKAEKLDLVLLILVKSGLVFKVPAVPADRYQLVHDYLVPYVRQQQSARLIAELEKEREQRKLTEAKLNQVLKRQLRDAWRANLSLIALLALMGGVATIAILVSVNTYISSLVSASHNNILLERLVSAIKVGKQLKRYPIGVLADTRFAAVSELNQAVYGSQERNRLDGHVGRITSVSFSPNGKMIATVSEDKIAKIWGIDGKEIITLKGHNTSVVFSSDSKMIATASQDKTAKIWSINGKEITTLKHDHSVTSAIFSHDGKMLATVSDDKIVRLWSLDGILINSLKHSSRVISVSFSYDGKIITAGKDNTVKIWGSDGKKIKDFNNYGTLSISLNSDRKTLMLVNKDSTVKFYDFNGNLLKTFNYQFSKYFNYTWMSVSSDGKQVAGTWRDATPPPIFIVKTTSDGRQSLKRINQTGYKDGITYLSFSPDGKLLASVSKKDRTVKLWSIESKDFSTTSNIGSKTKFSPDKQMIAAGSADNEVKLWRRDRTLLKTFQGDGSLLSFSPDGKTLVTGSANDIVKIWDSESGNIITLPGFSNRVTRLAISPNGKIIAAASLDKTVHLWKNDGTQIKILTGHTDKIASITFSSNSKIIATIGNNNVVKLWSSDGTLIKTLPGHTNQITKVIFSPNSEMIATIGDDNLVNINIWKSNGTPIKTLTGHTDQVTSVIFSRNNKVIASVSQGNNGINSEIRLWQSDGKWLKTIDDYGIQSISFSPDSSIIASIKSDNTVKLWKVRDATFLATLKGHQDKINELSFSPDGKTIATASDDSTVILWSLKGEKRNNLQEHNDKVNSVSFSHDGKIIASASDDKTVKLWSSDGRNIKTLSLDPDRVPSVRFSDDGNIITFSRWQDNSNHSRYRYILKILSRDGNQKLKILQGHTYGNQEGEIQALQSHSNEEDSKSSFSVSDNGKTVAFASKEDALELRSINGNLLATIKGHRDWINSVSFSNDGQTIASASDDKTVRLWSSDGKEIKILKGHSDQVNSVSFSPDDQTIASASNDTTVRLWSLKGNVIDAPYKHSDSVTSVTFSPDGQKIATASNGGEINLWNRGNGGGHPTKAFKGYSSEFDSLSFSPDGNILGYPSYDKRVSLYLLNRSWFNNFANLISNDSADFISSYPLSNVSFTSDGKAIAVANSDRVSVWNFLDLDELLVQGCDEARDYLKNNLNVDKGDLSLCDDISTHK